ncbi:hypothetical protein RHGRI_005359 [Rhododendron griersonianum]|uniref:Uncharacterized protein n=1 Tax=Rhododendron griersonianum TaxID=479676 RepID=A0AAV6LFA7_9ERIC|nr:hypothetical protein RHGRI_005359 [Rhododendron griersonianum]
MASKRSSQDKGNKSKGQCSSTSMVSVGVVEDCLTAAERTFQAQNAFDKENLNAEGLMNEISNANPTYLTVTNEDEAKTAREYAQTNQWRGGLSIIAKNERHSDCIRKAAEGSDVSDEKVFNEMKIFYN